MAQLPQRTHFIGSICQTVPLAALRVATTPTRPPKPTRAAARAPFWRNWRRVTGEGWGNGVHEGVMVLGLSPKSEIRRPKADNGAKLGGSGIHAFPPIEFVSDLRFMLCASSRGRR